MRHFFTPRQRRLMGLPEQETEPASTARAVPPRCCEQAVHEHCTCEARGWRCPTHGYTGEGCLPGRTHD